MKPRKPKPHDPRAADRRKVRALYQALLDGWNARAARKIAALFAEDGNVVGFDGSMVNGPAEIESHIGRIFTDHATPAYVAIVRDIRFLSPGTALVRAVAGMVPPGQSDIHPP
ncbi:MAG TPA: SgcJ/EcaC family oxidoreductase, partial [Candidatus Binatia bacterium]